jgi:hypothetical protein
MANLTNAQKIYLSALLLVAGAWLGLELGVPAYEYAHGKSELTALLEHAAAVLKYAVLGIVLLAWLLQRIGVLPIVKPDPALDRMVNPAGRLKNLAIWIVIALLLVFLFNLFQGGGNKTLVPASTSAPAPTQSSDLLLTMFINWFPMLLIFGVWVFFLRQMKTRQGNNPDKPNDR